MDHIVFDNYHQLLCLEANVSQKTLNVAACDAKKPQQKWKFEKYFEEWRIDFFYLINLLDTVKIAMNLITVFLHGCLNFLF